MGRNVVFNSIKPVTDEASPEKNPYVDFSKILVMWERVMDMMKEGFEAMESRFKTINEQLVDVNELIKQMEINNRNR